MKKIVKKNYKILIGFILGIIVSGVVVYAATITSDKVSYNNKNSGMSATTMQGALDELYEKVSKGNKNIVAAYTYNASSCYTGTESTCKKTTCYESKNSNSCPAGTLIEYKVNQSDTYMFNVMYDKGNTMVMQQQTPTVPSTNWITRTDYINAGGIVGNNGYGETDKGPLTALKSLESATSSWSNVENQTYQMGTTVFATNAYTGCNDSNGCTTNTYTLPSRTAKARMITYQEAKNLGCTSQSSSSPKWMVTGMYWTLSVPNSKGLVPYSISTTGSSDTIGLKAAYHMTAMNLPIRAVVVISK